MPARIAGVSSGMSARVLWVPLLVACLLMAAWPLHAVAYFIWLNVDHDSAFLWTRTLGAVAFTHCFGEDGWLSHGPEIAAVSLPVGGILGTIGVPFAAVGLVRAADRQTRQLAALVLAVHLGLIAPPLFLLRDANARLENAARENNAYLAKARRGPAKN